MFIPWIKRSSLKKSTKRNRLVVDGDKPSMIMLLSITGLLVVVGIFMVNRSRASNLFGPDASMSPSPSVSMSPSPSVSPSGAPR